MQLETFDSTKDKFKEIHKHKQMKNHVIINSRKKGKLCETENLIILCYVLYKYKTLTYS